MKLSQKLKQIKKTKNVNTAIYSAGIDVVLEAYLESKSPIDESFAFWSIVLRGLYGATDEEVVSMVMDNSLPEFIIECERVFKKDSLAKHYKKMYKEYKLNSGSENFIHRLIPDKNQVEDILEKMPEDIKDFFKELNLKEIVKNLRK